MSDTRVVALPVTREDADSRGMGRKPVQDALRSSEARFRAMSEALPLGIVVFDAQGRCVYANAAFREISGLAFEQTSSAEWSMAIHSQDRRRVLAEWRDAALAREPVRTEYRIVRTDGSVVWVRVNGAEMHVGTESQGQVQTVEDITARKSKEHLAQHDFLTGLPNRSLLAERFSRAIGMARRHRKQVALLFLDLDAFKHVNDSLGHAVGDQLLRSVADRLANSVRATDTVCRQGGDEFVILLAEIEQPRDAANVAEKLRAALAVPHFAGGHEVHVTSSIGIGVYPDDGVDADTVMRHADAAMYRAKAAGRNNYAFFSADTNTAAPMPGLRRAPTGVEKVPGETSKAMRTVAARFR